MRTVAQPYFFDTSIFIHAFDGYYAPQFTEFFWHEIMRLVSTGDIVVLDRVRNELKKQDDWLRDWIGGADPYLLHCIQDGDVMNAFGRVQRHIATPSTNYNPNTKVDWDKGVAADPWLIAAAIARDGTVVTDEHRVKIKGNSPGKFGWAIKIPDVCDELEVPSCDLFEAMTALNFTADAGMTTP